VSYILDALKKAERERRLGKIPGLENAPGLQASGYRRNRWTYVIAGALVLNAALLGALYLYWRDRAQSPPIETSVGQQNGPRGLAETASTVSEDLPKPERDPIQQSATKPVDTAVDDAEAALSLPAGEATAAVTAALPTVTTAAEPARPEPPPAGQTANTEPPIEAEPTITEPQAFSLKPPAEIAPLLADMPDSFRQSLRPVTLTVHVFSETPEQRFVFINDHRYQEGQQLVEGPMVESIQPNGVVLSHQGQRFMLTGDW